MAMATWLKEFYPTLAICVDESEALDHAIRKWTGLLKKNLRRHGLHIDGENDVTDEDNREFQIDGESCALCHYHGETEGCDSCPIVLHGEICCNDSSSAYLGWYKTHDARPMLAALKRVKRKMVT